MWSCDRRVFLMAAAALGGCGFAPVYGPGGAGNRLMNSVALQAPDTPEAYAFNRRFEERLGRASGPYVLKIALETSRKGLGSTTSGEVTRYRLLGAVDYRLTGSDGAVLIAGKTDAFTGYSTTGPTVSTLASEQDAEDRLMVLLADQVIDELLLRAGDLPADPTF